MSRSRRPYGGSDPRTRAAKAKGYPARSVFKLEEIDRRCGLFRPGQHVLDLGAAPGSWSLFASRKVGAAGRVVSVDLQAITQAFAANVVVVMGDVRHLDDPAVAEHAPYQVLLSDMAPATSGAALADQARSFELAMTALEVGVLYAAPGSSFVAKIFMSGDFPIARAAVAERYQQCRVIKPRGTRPNSSEIFLVGQGRR